MSTKIDVLIIGAGPAGLMAQLSLAKMGITNVRLIEKRATKIFTGQADGLAPRSFEVLHSLGLKKMLDETQPLGEIAFWNVQEGKLQRTGRISDTFPGISRFQQSTVHQGRVERHFLDEIKLAGGRPVERSVEPIALSIDESLVNDDSAYPVRVEIHHMTKEEAAPAIFNPNATGVFKTKLLLPDEIHSISPVIRHNAGTNEVIEAKYVIGCDGAKSWTRKALDIKLVGDSSNCYWGVLDGFPITNFPDIRLRCAIHSASSGSLMVIPRENGLVRLYIMMGVMEVGERLDRSAYSPQAILESAQRILSPYTIDIPEIDWWTVYEIGQRLATEFSKFDRVFIAGDACHTHSPKSGQGMNTSMNDTYNLTWKIGSVMRGEASRDILSTYNLERQYVAQELIDFDRKFSALFSGRPQSDIQDETGISLAEFKEAFNQSTAFTSGTAMNYQSSLITAKPGGECKAISRDDLIENVKLGQRFKSMQVVNIASATPIHIGDVMPSDGRWRMVVLPGDVRNVEQSAALKRLCTFLDSSAGPTRRYTLPERDVDSKIQILTIISNPRITVEENEFDEILRPQHGRYGYRSYATIFSDDESYHQGHGHAYEQWGVSERGAVVVIRPDGYVSLITSLDGTQSISSFFEGFMIEPKRAAAV